MMHDTHEMLWSGEYYRTAPLARAEYMTSATSVTIHHWNNVYEAQANAANIAVFADGDLVESFHAPSSGAHTNVVALPAGEKVVEVVIGGMRGPGNGNSDLPTLVGQGIFLSGLEFNAPAQHTPQKKGGLLVLTDSIGNGSTLANPAVEAYPSLLRRMVDYPVRVLGRGGMAFYDVTDRVGAQNAFFRTKLAREVARFQPDAVLFTLGYNDANKNVYTHQIAERLVAFSESLIQALPNAVMFVTRMTPAAVPPSGYTSVHNNLYRAFNGASGTLIWRMDWSTGVIGTEHLNDNVHPNAEGHQLMANFLANNIPDTQNIPGLTLLPESDVIEPFLERERAVRVWNSGRFRLYGGTGSARYMWDPPTFSSGGPLINYSGGNERVIYLFEFSVDGAEWRSYEGPSSDFPVSPGKDYVNIRIRRKGGDGTVLADENFYYE